MLGARGPGFLDIKDGVLLDTSTADVLSATWSGTAASKLEVIMRRHGTPSFLRPLVSSVLSLHLLVFHPRIAFLPSAPRHDQTLRALTQVTAVTSIKPDDVYISTTVTLKNVHTTTLYEVQYFRIIDPEQEQPWTDDTVTWNYVRYQPYRASDGDVHRSHPSYPNMCLVVADAPGEAYRGKLILGLGTCVYEACY